MPTAPPHDRAWGHAIAPGRDGVRIHYVALGSGPPAVLLHGWPGFWYDWRRVLPKLARTCRAIAPDYRGFGRSDPAPGDALDRSGEFELAADTVALLGWLGITRVVLVGYDIGSVVAQAIARQWPERVGALVLLNPSHPGIGARRYRPPVHSEFWYQDFHRLLWSDGLITSATDGVGIYLRHFFEHWTGQRSALQDSEIAAIVTEYERPGALRRSFAWYRSRLKDRARIEALPPEARRISVPTVILWGDRDPVFPRSWADNLAETFDDFSLETLPGVGHFVPIEAPDAVADAVLHALQTAAV